jgi:hypothetical protein
MISKFRFFASSSLVMSFIPGITTLMHYDHLPYFGETAIIQAADIKS